MLSRILKVAAALLAVAPAVAGFATPTLPTPASATVRPSALAPRRPGRIAPRSACDDDDGLGVAENDVVIFEFPSTGDRPELAGRRGVGVVRAEMHCTAHIQPLAERGAALVEDEAFDPVQVQGGDLAVLGASYDDGSDSEEERWTLDRRSDVPADARLPPADAPGG